jgi:hypothetical protein
MHMRLRPGLSLLLVLLLRIMFWKRGSSSVLWGRRWCVWEFWDILGRLLSISYAARMG